MKVLLTFKYYDRQITLHDISDNGAKDIYDMYMATGTKGTASIKSGDQTIMIDLDNVASVVISPSNQ